MKFRIDRIEATLKVPEHMQFMAKQDAENMQWLIDSLRAQVMLNTTARVDALEECLQKLMRICDTDDPTPERIQEVITSMVNEEETVRCPDCGIYFDGAESLDNGCPECLGPVDRGDFADREYDRKRES